MNANAPLHTYTIRGMDCADCARTLEKGVGKLPGVVAAQVNFPGDTLRVTGDVASERVREQVAALGYAVVDAAPAASK